LIKVKRSCRVANRIFYRERDLFDRKVGFNEQDMDALNSLLFLKHAFTEMEKWANKLTVNKEKPQHLFATALYIKIFELTAGCIILIDREVTTGVPILVGGILEAYVDFIYVKILHR
jgi:hypothetical protein